MTTNGTDSEIAAMDMAMDLGACEGPSAYHNRKEEGGDPEVGSCASAPSLPAGKRAAGWPNEAR